MEGAGAATEAPASAIGLVLAGPHPLTLYGLSHMFEKERDCTVLAVCTGADAILDAVRRHRPDLLILDFDRHGGLSVLRRVRREHPARLVVLAAAADSHELSDALQLGARAVVPKELAPDALVAHIRKIYHGAEALSVRDAPPTATGDVNPLVGRLLRHRMPLRQIMRQLTPRESEIARLAMRGISTADIATALGVKRGTVKIHLHSIYEKLNVDGRVGLVLVGRRHGLT